MCICGVCVYMVCMYAWVCVVCVYVCVICGMCVMCVWYMCDVYVNVYDMLCMGGVCMRKYVHLETLCVGWGWGDYGSQKRVLKHLKLETISCHVGLVPLQKQ